MKGLFIPGITAEMFRNGCLESIEALMAEGEIYDIEYSNWVPVSERMPEDRYAVLVWCPERKNIYCAYREENQWWIFGTYSIKVSLEVTAWMPLPEPYRAESDK